ncbi:helix-turn-helix domain-containing protein, partial [bacterium]
EEISRYLAMDYSYREIGICLNRSSSTICREVNNQGIKRSKYRAVNAEERAKIKIENKYRQRKLVKNLALQKIVIYYLKLRWSP